MKVLIPVLIGLLVVGCGENKQSNNTGKGNNTPENSAKKEVKDTPSNNSTAKTAKDKNNKETPTSTSWVSDPSDQNSVKIEAAIRKAAGKPTGKLTKVDLEKVTKLDLDENQLTDVKGLEKLTQLRELSLTRNQLTDV